MEPIIKELKITKTLLNAITFNGKEITEIKINSLILRPLLKRIVFLTSEIGRIIVYEGEDFDAHKDDSDDVLITALLAKIDSDYKS